MRPTPLMAAVCLLALLAAGCMQAQAHAPLPAVVLPVSSATVPAGRLVFDSDRNGNFEIYTLALDGSGISELTTNALFDTWSGRVSPDRGRILFYRSPRGVHDRDATQVSLWVMNADGTGQTLLLAPGAFGWAVQGHAEWSRDGTHLVMFGGQAINPQIFVTDPDGRNPRQVGQRSGLNSDPSWSPDGRTIVFTGCPSLFCFPSNHEVYTMASSGLGGATRVTSDDLGDYDPYFSPDGTQLAWLTQTSSAGALGAWNIRGSAANGSGLHMITSDSNVNSRPEWSQDGSTIYFHRLDYATSSTFQLYAMNSDGSNMHTITAGQPGNNEYPSS